MDEDRPRFIERAKKAVTPEDARQNRSNAMVTLGVVLLLVMAVAMSANDGGAGPGAIVLGVLAAGLIVGGLVIRR